MVIRFVKTYPFLCILIVVLALISIVTLKPGLFLMGWDNYSSYFNLKDQLFRTLFATWRDHRGLGVPSDSESTDIFRQLFFLLVRPFGLGLSDQLYFVTSLWLGVLGMYVFAKHISEDLLEHITERRIDLFAFIASFFYLFNLNTLSVYFFPIQPYSSRFFAIPIVFLFFRLIFKNKFTVKQYILMLFLIFFSSTAYVIGTVFVTLMIAISLYSVWSVSLKKAVAVIIFFLLLNAFWLLPFTNYTVQKSKLIRLAPTFISANESQLNKQKSFYSFTKQAILYPNFFETEYSSNDLTKKSFLHPLAATWNTFPTTIVIGIFPLLYLLGCALIIYDLKKRIKYLWIPSIILVFLFLSMKEFSPIGFLYSFFDDHVPLFGVLFRFGDTKFHPFIAFAGSIAAAYALTRIVNKKILIGILSLIIFGTLVVFKSYFSGQLIGFFMYNKVPDAYFKIANTINADSGEGRVLHLPYDKDIYWRSYKWGYLGSEFLGFMLRKPLIEKTFEPASMENAHVLKDIYDSLENIQAIQTTEGLDLRVSSYYSTLKKIGVRYVIVDKTVSAENVSRNAVFWGTYNGENASIIMNRLRDVGLAEVILREQVGNDEIVLYRIYDTTPVISFVQNDKPSSTTRLFMSPSDTFVQSNNTISIESSVPQGEVKMVTNPLGVSASHLVRVSVQKNEKGLVFSFYYVPHPSVNGLQDKVKIGELNLPDTSSEILKSISQKQDGTVVNNWHVLNHSHSVLRIRVDGTLLPIPTDISSQERFVGDVVVHADSFDVSLLSPDRFLTVPPESFTFTSDPNCFQDKLKKYKSSLIQNNGLVIKGQNGSVCLWTDLTSYLDNKTDTFELSLDIEASGEDTDSLELDKTSTAKPVLDTVIRDLPKPISTEVCIREGAIDECLNSHSIINIGTRKDYHFTVDQPLGQANEPTVLLAVKNNAFHTFEAHLYSAGLTTYKKMGTTMVQIPVLPESISTLFNSQTAHISFTKPMSRFAYYFQSGVDGFYIPSTPCDKASSYRTNRLLDDKLVSWTQNCQTNFFENIPFSSENFYLWSINYNLASGQYPKFILNDGFHSYVSRLASLDQGYPDIPEFKLFQRPELFANTLSTQKKLADLTTRYAYTYIYPSVGFDDRKNKNFSVEQYTENEGLMLVKGFEVVELPTDWHNTEIISTVPHRSFDVPANVQYDRILPSLWKVQISGQEGANYLLKFNVGYDNQWLMLGSNSHIRCEELFNCFGLKGKPRDQSYYIFYWPEVLSIVGWIISIGSIICFCVILSRKAKNLSRILH